MQSTPLNVTTSKLPSHAQWLKVKIKINESQ